VADSVPRAGASFLKAIPGASMSEPFNQPLSGNDMPRFGGIATMMRLPHAPSAAGLDACFVGVPLDIGTGNRSGTRFGPRQIRAESVLIRPYNMATGAAPFDSLQVADVGDIPTNPYNLLKSVDAIEAGITAILAHGCKPLSLGGDHTMVLPILRAMAKKHGPVGLIHVDAHADINDTMSGEKIAHGTPFRRAVEERLIDPNRTVQIGLRGSGYSAEDFDWPRHQGFRVYPAGDLWHRSLVPLMEEVRAHLGRGPVYITFDIDSLDPAFAQGTGTPEIGGLTSMQALEIIRGCWGLDIVGCDLVEVSPPYDLSGNTALTAANLLFELLCVLPGVKRRH
jgi:guanidinobutyrase